MNRKTALIILLAISLLAAAFRYREELWTLKNGVVTTSRPVAMSKPVPASGETTVYQWTALDANGASQVAGYITVEVTDSTAGSITTVVKIYKVVAGVPTAVFP